ncbi:UNVERIFIED_CONTAM: hypothetical protein FKN15_043128 [Acipenser sinensis]
MASAGPSCSQSDVNLQLICCESAVNLLLAEDTLITLGGIFSNSNYLVKEILGKLYERNATICEHHRTLFNGTRPRDLIVMSAVSLISICMPHFLSRCRSISERNPRLLLNSPADSDAGTSGAQLSPAPQTALLQDHSAQLSLSTTYSQ